MKDEINSFLSNLKWELAKLPRGRKFLIAIEYIKLKKSMMEGRIIR